MRKMFQFLLCLMFLTYSIYSTEDFSDYEIKGRVVEKKTGKPIPFVNVYLKNTTIGASTDAKGFYIIKSAPRGSYEIIASAIGYHFDSKTVKIFDKKLIKVDFMLSSKTYEIGEINVEAEENEEWQENYDIFRREILGNSRNSDMCSIKNPFEIEFNRKDNWLFVRSPKPIKIINKALGYEIDVELKFFKINLRNDEVSYTILPFYKPIEPKDSVEERFWNENRKRAFLGSTVHFLRCLAKESSYEDGYLIIPSETASGRDANSERFLFFDNEDKQYNIITAVVDTLSETQRSLSAMHYLQIVYKNEKEEYNYLNSNIGKRFGGNRMNGVQTSWIRIPMGKLYFDVIGSRGDFFTELDVLGYWGWERLADLVPENYVPNL